MEETKKATRLRELKVGARDLVILDPRIILVDEGHNPRDYELPENRAHVDALKISILKRGGVMVPMSVRFDSGRGAAIIVDGECRLRAVMELISEGHDIKGVPTYQVSGDELQRTVLALTANEGKQLTKMEKGKAFDRLKNGGWTVQQIADEFGIHGWYVEQAIELFLAPVAVKKMVATGVISEAIAIQHVRFHGDEAGAVLQAKIEAANGTVKRAKKMVPVVKIPRERSKGISESLQYLVERIQCGDPLEDHHVEQLKEAIAALNPPEKPAKAKKETAEEK